MSDTHEIIERSLDYHIDWCAHDFFPSWVQDWCVMPYLDILYTPKQLFRSTIKIGGDLQAYEAQNGEALLVPAAVLHDFETDECEM